MNKLFLFSILSCIFCFQIHAQNDSIMISGRVTDFNGNPMDSAMVEVFNANFRTAYEAYTNNKGEYILSVKQGTYLGLGALKMSEYPIAGSVLPKEDQRLEFWAWNVVANENLVLDIQYHRLEVYGVNIFRVQGARPGYTIYCRPMSLTRALSYEKNEKNMVLCPEPDQLEVKVEINGIEVAVNLKQRVEEYVSDGSLYAYLLHIDLPKTQNNKAYDVFRIEMKDLENGDRGEAITFKEKLIYE